MNRKGSWIFLQILFGCLCFLLFARCSVLSLRPDRHMSYAFAAIKAAKAAGGSTTAKKDYETALDSLRRARAEYRLKNFKLARRLAMRARYFAEKAEFAALMQSANPNVGSDQSGENDSFTF